MSPPGGREVMSNIQSGSQSHTMFWRTHVGSWHLLGSDVVRIWAFAHLVASGMLCCRVVPGAHSEALRFLMGVGAHGDTSQGLGIGR